MLADALVALRRERSPAKALARLDAYDSAFPRGSLRGEASVARVDALLALNRTAEALAQLQRLPIMSLPRSNELRVVRAELSARQGRCDAAITDANATLTQTPDGALAARAKQVLASCVSH
jgi:outer membrane PBP1 activator LpoA protein